MPNQRLQLDFTRIPRWRDFERRAKEILGRIQVDLLPDQASKIVAINVDTGEYTISDDPIEAQKAFQERWPDQFCYLIRADGGPVVKFHGHVPR